MVHTVPCVTCLLSHLRETINIVTLQLQGDKSVYWLAHNYNFIYISVRLIKIDSSTALLHSPKLTIWPKNANNPYWPSYHNIKILNCAISSFLTYLTFFINYIIKIIKTHFIFNFCSYMYIYIPLEFFCWVHLSQISK